jgi:hypothetical protein
MQGTMTGKLFVNGTILGEGCLFLPADYDALGAVLTKASEDSQRSFCNVAFTTKYFINGMKKLENWRKRAFHGLPYNGIANSKHKPRQVRMRHGK